VYTCIVSMTASFAPVRQVHHRFTMAGTKTTMLCSTSRRSNQDISEMRVAQIRDELNERKISFSDCFDKESLVIRLQEARSTTPSSSPSESIKSPTSTTTTRKKPSSENAETKNSTWQDDATKVDEETVRAMSVRALREELGNRQIRWAGLLEKEDLVQAVIKAREEGAMFSVTGRLTPGQVGELTGDELERELFQPTAASSVGGSSLPLLLDVYATWCGPCQLVAPQLREAARILGDRVRVAKMDSDKEQKAAGKLRVQGLPSLVLFRDGQEIDRVEGALMKDQIVDWVSSKLR
jgi:thioredoxin